MSLLQALGQLVMKKSSPEGAAMIQEDLRKLVESWQALRLLEENLLSLIRNQQLQRSEVDTGKKLVFTNNIPKAGFLIDPRDPIPRRRHGANLLEEHDLHEDHSQLLRDFEQWLQAENSKLLGIITMRTATAKDLRTKEMKLQELEARIPEGQRLFENLLRVRPARDPGEELEDLRYRWMLYKSKLKDSGHLLVRARVKGWGVPGGNHSWIYLVHSGTSVHTPGHRDCSEEGTLSGLRHSAHVILFVHLASR